MSRRTVWETVYKRFDPFRPADTSARQIFLLGRSWSGSPTTPMEGNLGSVLLALGETERGIALRCRAHEMLRVQLGPDHPSTRDMGRRPPRAVSGADAAEPHAVEAKNGTPGARDAPGS